MPEIRVRRDDVYTEQSGANELHLWLGDPDEHDPNTYYTLDRAAMRRLFHRIGLALRNR